MKRDADDLIVASIALCGVPTERKDLSVVLAYCTDKQEGITVTMIPFPKKKKYDYQDVLEEIKKTEGVKNVTYLYGDGQKKDIFVCRPASGEVFDIVERNFAENCFYDGFAEVTSSQLKFSFSGELPNKIKFNHIYTFKPENRQKTMEENSLEYAINNACNACFLAKRFIDSELDMESKYKERIKIEVCECKSVYRENVLYLIPIQDGLDRFVECYRTEEFNFIDGTELSTRRYKVYYNSRFQNYEIIRD